AGMSTGSAYKEGATLTPLAASSVDRAYERKAGVVAGTLQDTDDNGTDFVLVTPTNAQSLGLTAATTSLDFGSVNVSELASLNTTIKNNLFAATVTLTPPFTIAGANASEFTAGSPATTSLAGGATTTIPVTFAP